jgi:glycopeptide antibiotics resistance protein
MYINFDTYGIPLWPIAASVLLTLMAILRRRQRSIWHLLGFAIFGVYAICALDLVFFPIDISGAYAEVMRNIPISSHVNLVPFYFGPYGLTDASLVTLLNNILLTIPLGFGLSFIVRVKFRDFSIIAVAVGSSIELLQLVVSLILGYPYRVVDINDVIFNALGVLVGYGFFWLFSMAYLRMTRNKTMNGIGLGAFLHGVAEQVEKKKPDC